MAPQLVAFYKNHRLKIAYSVMLLVLFAPYLDTIFTTAGIREKILSALPLFILFLLNDWRTETDSHLKKIETNLNNPEPPLFQSGFRDVEPELEKLISGYVKKGTPVTIEIIAVSSSFSWKFFERILPSYLNNPSKNQKLTIHTAVSSEATLKRWNLSKWLDSLQFTMKSFRTFESKYKKSMADSETNLQFFHYDNLPQWHGVLVNGAVLFLGRTEWIQTGDGKNWELKVGEVEYRRFELEDSYGGRSRISRFSTWFERYKSRGDEPQDGNNAV